MEKQPACPVEFEDSPHFARHDSSRPRFEIFSQVADSFRRLSALIERAAMPPQPGENLSKVCENSRAGENTWIHLRFSLICFQILQNIRLGFHQAMKAWRKIKHALSLFSTLMKHGFLTKQSTHRGSYSIYIMKCNKKVLSLQPTNKYFSCWVVNPNGFQNCSTIICDLYFLVTAK